MPSWRLINVAETMLIPRINPGVCVLNQQEIVVMGGLANLDDVISCLGDVVLFNTVSESFEKRVQNFAGLTQFQTTGNKCALFEEDTVVCLAENNYEEEDEKSFVVEYKKGTKMIRKIQQL